MCLIRSNKWGNPCLEPSGRIQTPRSLFNINTAYDAAEFGRAANTHVTRAYLIRRRQTHTGTDLKLEPPQRRCSVAGAYEDKRRGLAAGLLKASVM
ncbi:hypothetical protein EVAR_67772_1 [Eumeta japonica]|uniref:Uncharacterized protein n=1 Tax=Eumeta variegata TaxID=151549 RepID=A0A4C1ZIC1_EUMVA|nr:hypothetical protein EVAR_67772_1 [Eumeta japonica]